ncbi:hypothetical protein [Rhodanobacter ginsengiterrae]|uniref:hypothetical protein n=1 Tax=Rhodanobacter ginsengiterrae TaxID=2008451 RepID=UPI003CF338BD
MAHGSTHLQARETHSVRRAWLVAFGRGSILGFVISLHLVLLALLFGPVTPLRAVADGPRGQRNVLLIRWVAQVVTPRRVRTVQKRAVQDMRVPRAASRAIPAPEVAAEPGPTASAAAAPAGDYHSPLLSGRTGMAEPPSVSRLPGADATYVRGIVLNEGSSLHQVVRAMTHANRCQYTRMKMGQSPHQFVTRQLMERALEADGCGPQTAHSAADDTVEAISRQAIFGH